MPETTNPTIEERATRVANTGDLLKNLGDLSPEERKDRTNRAMTSVLLEAEAEVITTYREAMREAVALLGLGVALEGKKEASDVLLIVMDLLGEDAFEVSLRKKAQEARDGV